MADRRRKGRRKDKFNDKPTKQEMAVAKYLRFKCPSKNSVFLGDQVAYFTGSKAVDVLLESRWASNKKELLFTNRNSCVNYLQDLLDKGLFFHARKLIPKRRDRAELKDGKKEKAKKADANPADSAAAKKPAAEGAKKPRKIKLDVHAEQVFIDGSDVYVWKYNPTSPKTFILGLLMVVGAALVCLFPLWPTNVRVGVYYLSVLAMGFIGVIMALACVRAVVFCLVWVATLGKHSFWLLPNLTEDCGFFESFKPLYTHTVRAKSVKGSRKKKTDEDEPNIDDDAGRESDSCDADCRDGENGAASASDSSDSQATGNRASNGKTDGSSDGQLRENSSAADFEMVEKPNEP